MKEFMTFLGIVIAVVGGIISEKWINKLILAVIGISIMTVTLLLTTYQ